ncbi:SAV_2336 N-terminal domain-related protein [Streptomyces sp. NPDC059828]|uniref:caspase, EACC1-associated type n=1 Tax=Streptomyces sp. NPDC059828 TaxID=3346965 RepID=UPI00364BCFC9
MFRELREVLGAAGVPAGEGDLLDILWLAARVPSGPAAPLAVLAAEEAAAGAPGPGDPTHAPGTDTGDPGSHDRDPGGGSPTRTAETAQDRADRVGVHAGPPPPGDAARRALLVPGARALGTELRLGRALRPLKRQVRSHQEYALDEAATAAVQADTRTPQVVLRPRPERWMRLALVLDSGVSMALWERHCSGLKGLFERSGAFRQVETYQLRYGSGEAGVRLGRPWCASSVTCAPGSLADASGQSMVLVVTDGAAAAWRDGRLRRVLESWARKGPTAVVHMLPRRLWPGSGVRADTWHVASPRPGAPNQAWQATDLVLPPSVAPPPEIPIPVLELSAAGFAGWAAVNTVVGRPVPVQLWATDGGTAHTERPGRVSVVDFSHAASPEALRLAAHLAAMAPVSVPVMQLVHSCLSAQEGMAPLAEVLLGGLVQPLADSEAARPGGRNRLFDFASDAKDLLLDSVPTADLIECGRRVGERLETLVGRSSDFPAWLLDDHGPGAGAPFAYLGPDMRARLGSVVTMTQNTAPGTIVLSPSRTDPAAGSGPGAGPHSGGTADTADMASLWLSTDGLDASLRLLFATLGSKGGALATAAGVSSAQLADYAAGRRVPPWSFAVTLLTEASRPRVRGGPPTEMADVLLAQYIDAAVALRPAAVRATFARLSGDLHARQVPREALLLLLHLLTYLHARLPAPLDSGTPSSVPPGSPGAPPITEREFVEELAQCIAAEGVPLSRQLRRRGTRRTRHDLAWLTSEHCLPVNVRRMASPFSWEDFAWLAHTTGDPDESDPAAFLVMLDDDEPDGPLLLDDCVAWRTRPLSPGVVVGLRLPTALLRNGPPAPVLPLRDPDTEGAGQAAASRRVCIAVEAVGYGEMSAEVQRAEREITSHILAQAVRAAGVDLDACLFEDRGDATLLLLPRGVDETAAVPAFIDGIVAALKDAYAQRQYPRLRLAVEHGAVATEEYGFAGDAVLRASRLVDSAVLRESLEVQPRATHALIMGEELYESLPALHGRFQRVRVDLKGYRAWARMYPALPEVVRPPVRPATDRSNAVLVGVGAYQHLDPLPSVLTGVHDLAALLTDPAGGAFADQLTTVLADPMGLEEILDAVGQAVESAQHTLLVYFAGHSLLDPETGELMLAVGQTRAQDPYSALAYRHLRSLLLRSRARYKVVILDCCYSGRAILSSLRPDDTGIRTDIGTGFVMAASGAAGRALAPAGDQYTPFTGELIHVLRNGLAQGPELITAELLYREVTQRLQERGYPRPQAVSHDGAGMAPLALNRAH